MGFYGSCGLLLGGLLEVFVDLIFEWVCGVVNFHTVGRFNGLICFTLPRVCVLFY